MKRSLGEIVAATPDPLTVPVLKADLTKFGVQPGMTILCHTSLSSLGWVNGGAQAVIQALSEALGRQGTLVMPTHSPDLSNPALWSNPPVPESWWQAICATMPSWDTFLTPSNGMGSVAEAFRKDRGVVRSDHPHFSFAAKGRLTGRICNTHRLDFGLGNGSPLARLYDAGAKILLIGCGWESCTAFHLAEDRCSWSWKKEQTEYAPLKKKGWLSRGRTRWQSIRNWNIHSDDFGACGKDFEIHRAHAFRLANIGLASCRLIDLRSAVDFAQGWLPQHRA